MKPAERECAIISALEAGGAMDLRSLGRATGMDHSTLNSDLKRLEDLGVVAHDETRWGINAKRTRYTWRLT